MPVTAFRKQLIAGWLISLVLVAGISATAIVALHVTTTSEGALAHDLVDDLASVQRLRFQAEQVVAATRGYLLAGESQSKVRLDAARADFETRLHELRARRTDDEGAREATDVDRAARAYTLAADGAAGERATTTDARVIVSYFDETLQPRRADFETSVNAFADHQRATFDASLDRATSSAHSAQLILVVAALAAIALEIGLAFAVVRAPTSQFIQLNRAQDAAETAAAAREELLAVVSHDLRNPLHAILLASTLLDNPECDAPTSRQVRIVRNAATRMQHMIDELLEAAQLDANRLVLHCETCDSGRLLGETLELFLTRAAEQNIELSAAPADATIVGDRERILEILSNLVGNALKFTPPGGHVAVSTERCERGLRFAVTDTGPGIAPHQVAHLFDRYWQGDRTKARTGLGLGLYICKRLVEAHHGSIGVDSKLGVGTTFWFDMPATTNEHAPNAQG